jgi:glutamyl/glutaminyl-tRNA synthetase
MNGWHIRQLSVDELYGRIGPQFWPASAVDHDDAYKSRVLALVQERLKYYGELPQLTDFFFEDLPVNPELISTNKQLKKLNQEELKDLLTQASAALQISDFSPEELTITLNNLLIQTGQKPGILFSLIRIATTQAPASPGLAETLALLGKDTCLRRIDLTLAAL